MLDFLRDEDTPRLKEWLKLRDYLEGSLKFKRDEQRARRKAKVFHPWIDGKIAESIKKNYLTLQFLDQLIVEARELEEQEK